MQGFNQPRRGPSKSRPSLAAMLDSIDQDNAGLLDSPKFKPLEPLRPSSSGRFGVDPYDFDTAARLLGDNSLLLDPFATGRSPLKLPKKPPLLIPGLDGPGKSSSGSSVYPQSTSRSRSNGTKSSSEKSSWSAVGNRLFTDEVQATLKSNTREPGIFTAEYNELARKHGLQPLPAEHQVKPSDVSVSSISQGANSPNPSPNANATGGSPAGPLGKGARAINRMLKRTNSTKDISERSRKTLGHPLGQKAVGIKHLSGFRKKKKDGLLGMHLEDMVRLGGVCQLDLPEKMRPGSLLIPACFHATASYILDHGLTVPGLFRVAGSPAATDALYDYYERQLSSMRGVEVVQSTALATLPTHLSYTVNDVAHLFKRLISCLPGGLLGSPPVFQALFSVQSYLFPDPNLPPQQAKQLRPRMIALALANLNLHFRLSLICAVFGLLRCVALSTHETVDDTKILKPAEAFTFMKLGIIFGPLLLGDKSDQLLVKEERGGLLVLPSIAPPPDVKPLKGKFGRKNNEYTQMQREKARRAALVVEMIINNWEDVVEQMKKIGALEYTARACDIPDNMSKLSENALQQKGTDTPHRLALKRSPSMMNMAGGARSAPGTSRYSYPPTTDDYGIPGKHKHHLHVKGHSFHAVKGGISRTTSKATDLMHFSHHGSSKRGDESKTPSLMPTPLVGEHNLSEVDQLLETPQADLNVVYDKSQDLSIFIQNTPAKAPDPPQNPPPDPPQEDGGFSIKSKVLRYRAANRASEPALVGRSGQDNIFQDLPNTEVDDLPLTREEHLALMTNPPSEAYNPNEDLPAQPLGIIEESATRSESPPYAPDLTDEGHHVADVPPRVSSVPQKQNSKKGFRIYQDRANHGDLPSEETPLPEAAPAPAVTLTKPDSDVEIPIKPHRSRSQSPPTLTHSPSAEEATPYPTPGGVLEPASSSDTNISKLAIDSDFEDRYSWRRAEPIKDGDSPAKQTNRHSVPTPGISTETSSSSRVSMQLPGNSALYDEITRLKRLVEQKTEEADKTKRELELARKMANAGALSQLLRETREEVKVWRNRAEWAERLLSGVDGAVIGEMGGDSSGVGNGGRAEGFDGAGVRTPVPLQRRRSRPVSMIVGGSSRYGAGFGTGSGSMTGGGGNGRGGGIPGGGPSPNSGGNTNGLVRRTAGSRKYSTGGVWPPGPIP